MRRLRPGLLVAAVALAVAACGVPLQESAQPIPGLHTQHPAAPSPSATMHDVGLWLVSEGRLVRVQARTSLPESATDLIALLASPPTTAGSLRSLVADPVGGGSLVTVAPDQPLSPAAPPVLVQVSPTFSSLPPTEQVLLLGQVVLTLTGAGASGVSVTDTNGAPLSVPLPDGRLLEGPATRADYLPLTGPLPTRSS